MVNESQPNITSEGQEVKPLDGSAKRLTGAEAAPEDSDGYDFDEDIPPLPRAKPRKRKWIESPDAGHPNYNERD